MILNEEIVNYKVAAPFEHYNFDLDTFSICCYLKVLKSYIWNYENLKHNFLTLNGYKWKVINCRVFDLFVYYNFE
jgi:hypothetical protein